MKKFISFICVICVCFVISACSFQKNVNIKSIEIIEKTVPDYILVGEFDEAGIEAMAYNLPIISTDAAGLVEMFGRAALIVKSDGDGKLDTDDFARQMCRVIESSSLRMRLGVMSYGRYKERYTAKKMAKDTIKLYENLLKS